jgi:two-component system CheB/CheR fusion protein
MTTDEDCVATGLDQAAETAAGADGPFDGLIVALGASAGGLDALDRFFAALAPTDAAAFVVIQHLAPGHKTMMDTLLARQTEMHVTVAEDGTLVEGGHVYVIPPGKLLTLESGRLCTAPRPETGITLPIDAFLRSLSKRSGPAAGVILSGTGSDGTLGVEALAQAGGWVLVQDPQTARFDGMPLNAQATGLADEVLPPEALAEQITEIIARPGAHPGRLLAEDGSGVVGPLAVVELLRNVSNVDFSQYKPDSLIRRVKRRMQASGTLTLQAYADHLAANPTEVIALRKELFIAVTQFFRDADAFDCLRTEVLEPLVAERRAAGDDQLRIWVAGCATGQEAYSLTMMLLEVIEAAGVTQQLKVFATDVEPMYVDAASQGSFSDAELENLSAAQRERWFVRQDNGRWQARPELRRPIVFARHDILTDPPFTNLDLVACRNLLIYLRTASQERALRRLTYGLRAGGVLFLGLSESPSAASGDFDVIDSRLKLYRLRWRQRRLPPADLLPTAHAQRATHHAQRSEAIAAEAHLVQGSLESLVTRYAPPTVLVNAEREVEHFFGDSDRLMRLGTGDASLDLVRLLPRGLRPVVATLLHSAQRTGTAQRSQPLQFTTADDAAETLSCRVFVSPLATESGRPPAKLLVSFEELGTPEPRQVPVAQADLAEMSQQHVVDLERELAVTRSGLEDTIQQLGTANEELQATNEELMASNEELQSTNEELQSVNEELYSVNSEYQSKLQEVNEVNADLETLTRATGLPIVFLDDTLRVTRYTPQVVEIFSLRDSDIGRPITDFSHGLEDADLFEILRDALEFGEPRQFETRDAAGRAWLVRVVPFAGRGDGPARIVVSFVDVSSLRDAERLQAILDAVPENVCVLDRTGCITIVNRAWQDFGDCNGAPDGAGTGLGTNYLDVCRAAAVTDVHAREVVSGITGVLEGSRANYSLLYPCHGPQEKRWFIMHVTPLGGGGCVVTHFNVTSWLGEIRKAVGA